jgi:hypothetical protein
MDYRVLLYTTLITPYRLAFIDEDTLGWTIAATVVDLVFFCDIILTFYTAYYDQDDNLVVNKKKIACHYLKGWFILDFVSIIPVSYMLQTDNNYTSLVRLSRLPRLYKLIKMGK